MNFFQMDIRPREFWVGVGNRIKQGCVVLKLFSLNWNKGQANTLFTADREENAACGDTCGHRSWKKVPVTVPNNLSVAPSSNVSQNILKQAWSYKTLESCGHLSCDMTHHRIKKISSQRSPLTSNHLTQVSPESDGLLDNLGTKPTIVQNILHYCVCTLQLLRSSILCKSYNIPESNLDWVTKSLGTTIHLSCTGTKLIVP